MYNKQSNRKFNVGAMTWTGTHRKNEIKGMVSSGWEPSQLILQVVKRPKGLALPTGGKNPNQSPCKCNQGWGQALSQIGNRTLQPWLCSIFRVMKDTGGKELWNLLPRLRKAPEARHESPERSFQEAANVKPELCSRPPRCWWWQSCGRPT